MKNLLKRILSVIAIAILFALNIFGSYSFSVDDYGEFNPDYLVFRVGYEGGPYLNIHTFSRSELEGMDEDKVVAYTHIKGDGKIGYDFGKGVNFEDLLRIAGIDKRSIKRFTFVTEDKYIVNNRDLYRDYILETDRYHYPNLIEYIDNPEEGKSGGIIVKPMLAHSSLPGMLEMDLTTDKEELKRMYDEAETGATIMPHIGFRLMMGAPPSLDNTAMLSATNVYQINVVLAGKPAVNVKPTTVIRKDKYGNETEIDVGPNYQPQVGDIIRTEVEKDTIEIDSENDPRNQIVESDLYEVSYRSTDLFEDAMKKHYGEENMPKPKIEVNENVAEVLEDGSIKIIGEGDIELRARYVDLGEKDIFEGREGYLGFIESFFKDKTEGKEYDNIKTVSPRSEDKLEEEKPDGNPEDKLEEEKPDGNPEDKLEEEKPDGNPEDKLEEEKPDGNLEDKLEEEKPDGNLEDELKGDKPNGKSGNKNNITKTVRGGSPSGNISEPVADVSNNTWLQISDAPISLGERSPINNQSRNNGTVNSLDSRSRVASGSKNKNSEAERTNTSGTTSENVSKKSDDTPTDSKTASSSTISESSDYESIFDKNIAKEKSAEKKDRAVSRQIYEMDEDSKILGELELANPLKPWAAGVGIVSFIYGLFYAKWRFIRSL